MSDSVPQKRRHQARKSATSSHPLAPPILPDSVEVLFYGIRPALLDSATSDFRDQIVTSQILYHPGLLAAARVTFQGTRWEIHQERDIVQVIPFPPHAGVGEWDKNLVPHWDNRNIRSSAEGTAFYAYNSSHEFSHERFEILKEDFIKSIVTRETLQIAYNPYLKIHKKLDEPEEAFVDRCLQELRKSHDQEIKILQDTILRQQERLRERFQRGIRELGAEAINLSQRGRATAKVSHVATQEQDLQESMTQEDLRNESLKLEAQREQKIHEFESTMMTLARELELDILRLNRANVQLLRFALVWLPYTEFVIQEDDRRSLKLIQSF
ncbi:MAG TPA: hypothetical protein VJ521_13130 [Acidobacteriota bacterium]|nr:hypothetical protein [Acidobacteriota bacterium]